MVQSTRSSPAGWQFLPRVHGDGHTARNHLLIGKNLLADRDGSRETPIPIVGMRLPYFDTSWRVPDGATFTTSAASGRLEAGENLGNLPMRIPTIGFVRTLRAP